MSAFCLFCPTLACCAHIFASTLHIGAFFQSASLPRRQALTNVPITATYVPESSRPIKDAVAEANCGGGARGGARGRTCNPLPGRSGHHACRHYDRRAGCAAGSGVIVGGVKPAPWTVTTRSLARIAPRDHTPLGKNRGGAPEGEPSALRTAPRPAGGLRKANCLRCAEVRPRVFRRSIFLFRHCERREAIQVVSSVSGLLRRYRSSQ